MSGAAVRFTVTQYATAYRAMTRAGAPQQLREAAAAACPYRRPYLVAAFEAGWFAWVTVRHLEGDFTVPHLSKTAQKAWKAGHQARQQHEQTTTQEATQ